MSEDKTEPVLTVDSSTSVAVLDECDNGQAVVDGGSVVCCEVLEKNKVKDCTEMKEDSLQIDAGCDNTLNFVECSNGAIKSNSFNDSKDSTDDAEIRNDDGMSHGTIQSVYDNDGSHNLNQSHSDIKERLTSDNSDIKEGHEDLSAARSIENENNLSNIQLLTNNESGQRVLAVVSEKSSEVILSDKIESHSNDKCKAMESNPSLEQEQDQLVNKSALTNNESEDNSLKDQQKNDILSQDTAAKPSKKKTSEAKGGIKYQSLLETLQLLKETSNVTEPAPRGRSRSRSGSARTESRQRNDNTSKDGRSRNRSRSRSTSRSRNTKRKRSVSRSNDERVNRSRSKSKRRSGSKEQSGKSLRSSRYRSSRSRSLSRQRTGDRRNSGSRRDRSRDRSRRESSRDSGSRYGSRSRRDSSRDDSARNSSRSRRSRDKSPGRRRSRSRERARRDRERSVDKTVRDEEKGKKNDSSMEGNLSASCREKNSSYDEKRDADASNKTTRWRSQDDEYSQIKSQMGSAREYRGNRDERPVYRREEEFGRRRDNYGGSSNYNEQSSRKNESQDWNERDRVRSQKDDSGDNWEAVIGGSLSLIRRGLDESRNTSRDNESSAARGIQPSVTGDISRRDNLALSIESSKRSDEREKSSNISVLLTKNQTTGRSSYNDPLDTTEDRMGSKGQRVDDSQHKDSSKPKRPEADKVEERSTGPLLNVSNPPPNFFNPKVRQELPNVMRPIENEASFTRHPLPVSIGFLPVSRPMLIQKGPPRMLAGPFQMIQDPPGNRFGNLPNRLPFQLEWRFVGGQELVRLPFTPPPPVGPPPNEMIRQQHVILSRNQPPPPPFVLPHQFHQQIQGMPHNAGQLRPLPPGVPPEFHNRFITVPPLPPNSMVRQGMSDPHPPPLPLLPSPHPTQAGVVITSDAGGLMVRHHIPVMTSSLIRDVIPLPPPTSASGANAPMQGHPSGFPHPSQPQLPPGFRPPGSSSSSHNTQLGERGAGHMNTIAPSTNIQGQQMNQSSKSTDQRMYNARNDSETSSVEENNDDASPIAIFRDDSSQEFDASVSAKMWHSESREKSTTVSPGKGLTATRVYGVLSSATTSHSHLPSVSSRERENNASKSMVTAYSSRQASNVATGKSSRDSECITIDKDYSSDVSMEILDDSSDDDSDVQIREVSVRTPPTPQKTVKKLPSKPAEPLSVQKLFTDAGMPEILAGASPASRASSTAKPEHRRDFEERIGAILSSENDNLLTDKHRNATREDSTTLKSSTSFSDVETSKSIRSSASFLTQPSPISSLAAASLPAAAATLRAHVAPMPQTSLPQPTHRPHAAVGPHSVFKELGMSDGGFDMVQVADLKKVLETVRTVVQTSAGVASVSAAVSAATAAATASLDKSKGSKQNMDKVVEEVKQALKPHYGKGSITKDEYKDIMRRAVPKICHGVKGNDVVAEKVQHFVDQYVDKVIKARRTIASVKPQTRTSDGLPLPGDVRSTHKTSKH